MTPLRHLRRHPVLELRSPAYELLRRAGDALIEALASMKGFKPRDGGDGEPPASEGRIAEADFKGVVSRDVV